ncbi:MAG: PAS domain S-box protein [Nitrospirae bacterium]|nr:PAS domain S-box protein [Nitrospirota bacterium]
MPRRLYGHLLLLVSLILTLTFLSYGHFTGERQSEAYLKAMKRNAEVMTNNLAISCANYLVVRDYAAMEVFLLRSAELPDVRRIQVSDRDGKALTDIVHNTGSSPAILYGLPSIKIPSSVKGSIQIENDRIVIYQPITAGSLLGWVKVNYSMETVSDMKRILWRNSLLIGISGILVSFVLILMTLRPPIRAIKRLTDFARRLDDLKGEQIPVEHSFIEIEQLGESLNYASLEVYSTERKLVEERERLAVTLRSIGDGVAATDTEGRIVLMNKAAEALTGWTAEEVEGKPLREVFHITEVEEKPLRKAFPLTDEETRKPADDLVERVLKTGSIGVHYNHFLTSRDGTEKSIADSGAPIIDKDGKIIGTVLVFRDVTERRKMEAQLLRSQRIEAVGSLASGIAHDFNNLLSAIMGYSEIMLEMAKEGDPFYKPANIIYNAAERGTELVKGMLTITQRKKIETKPVDINEAIKNSIEILRRTIPGNIEIITKLEEGVPLIMANSTQIQQVIMNLSINARDAMPDGGILTIETAVVGEGNGAVNGIHAEEGGFVNLSVSDTGLGMDEDTKRKIFDPFFTTKEAGKGTGLGLYTVHLITSNHRGYINLYSEPNKGTRFSIYLPITKVVDIEEPLKAEGLTGSGTILVIDDDARIRELCMDILKPLGYRVLLAGDGSEGIDIFKTMKDEISLVITDIIMPKIGGSEVFQALRTIKPDAKVMLFSGYSQNGFTDIDKLLKSGAKGFIQKPFTRYAIAYAIKKALSEE